jgi:hypothetical protein
MLAYERPWRLEPPRPTSVSRQASLIWLRRPKETQSGARVDSEAGDQLRSHICTSLGAIPLEYVGSNSFSRNRPKKQLPVGPIVHMSLHHFHDDLESVSLNLLEEQAQFM